MSEQEEDFAALFEASVKTAKRFERGQMVEGTIVALGPKVALVNFGGKSEAEIDLIELKDDDGDVEVSVGDRLQAMVVSTAGRIQLSRKGVRNAATQRELEDAFQAGLAVEGRVEKAVKGGYEVRIARERAFCPFSQIDIVRTTDPAVHEGKTYAFRIIEYKDGGKNVVVSRRQQLEEEQRASADAVRASIVAGAVLPGRVTSVLDFGAFVDLGGGIQGLLHVSEMGWSRVSANEVTAPGDQITVKVLRVDEATGKIALGLKQLQNDPWVQVAEGYAVGQVRSGKVTRVAEFGAFVELEPGIEGLAHASTFAPTGRAGGWTKSVAPGTTGAFEILSIDVPQKRIGIAMVEEGSSRAAGAISTQSGIVPGAIVTGKVDKHEKFGVFVFLAPGKTGLIPFAETGVDRDEDLLKAFPPGGDVEVVVLEVDPAGRRIRLSRKAVAEQRERAELREYAERADATPSASLGSLADKLRGALGGR
ncbi:MAG: S1 RNA-binding domain-containing protein [Acidobacteria bacterium]|nr:S1 RNA-binding domain-containing protein [Acidobacteriota bacterium]